MLIYTNTRKTARLIEGKSDKFSFVSFPFSVVSKSTNKNVQWLFLLLLPIVSISSTKAHEEVFPSSADLNLYLRSPIRRREWYQREKSRGGSLWNNFSTANINFYRFYRLRRGRHDSTNVSTTRANWQNYFIGISANAACCHESLDFSVLITSRKLSRQSDNPKVNLVS